MADGDGSTKMCVACNVEKPLEDFSKDRSRPGGLKKRCKVCHAAQTRDYLSRNRVEVCERKRHWRLRNLDKVRAKDLLYCSLNREKACARSQAWFAANKDRARVNKRAWAARNKDKIRLYLSTYRRKRRVGRGRVNAEEVAVLMRMQKGKCAYCRKLVRNKYELDHIMPVSLGGGNAISNFQITCRHCNRQKCGKHPLQFARGRGLLL